ncbi:hypothetical protein PCANC_18730 [Puccinia coronata f. sp. avenae]|uniref:Uncharacterized protein n=1 Tax=Puccinia coronata f. sp. avenae TaxID=200324 RepID=A0A2N5UAS9_9BASI|nr:hypothetical protein PCANC_18730 [Puccinia coronata f. sp. avenae]
MAGFTGAPLQSGHPRASGASHQSSRVQSVPSVRGVSLHPPGVPSLSQGPSPSWSREPPRAPPPQWPGLTPCQGANSSSEDAQSDLVLLVPDATCLRDAWSLIGDPARIAEATRVFNEAHPRAPTTDPIDTDSDPADAQSEPLLTNDQGDPVSTTYPFTNFSRPATPNPPGFFDPEDYHRLDDDQIHALLRRDHEPARFDRFALVLNTLPTSTNPPCPPWCRTTPDSLLATEPSAPTACKPSSSSPAAITRLIELCAANKLRPPIGLNTTSYELPG